ncbi:hypothetical protein TSAR_016865 [Trichomalopsis sarcophagae]|uniref:NADH dehydrogenase [ubiquinone] 1 alpha subcomplex subunit 11 n=1 Tax=Trichomalopsis sarcophagae TaxID=543379 RepID=A0A232EKK5_9HYME|nr:hypothetical protein TSAR_016865 [Trichomalopsis sarcophagae]
MVLLRIMMEKFNYYDKPEGEDPIGKIMGLAKYGILTGGFLTIYDACMYSQCANAAQFFNTAGYWMLPITGMCVTFSAVTYTATNLRKKDDKINYVLGALASGAVMHAWLKQPLYSGWGTFFLVGYALAKKDYKQNCPSKNPILPNPEDVNKQYFLWRNLPYRNYTWKLRWEPDREDYYRNF